MRERKKKEIQFSFSKVSASAYESVCYRRVDCTSITITDYCVTALTLEVKLALSAKVICYLDLIVQGHFETTL